VSVETRTTPLVSFVLPCYKHGHFLADCVNSILAQTFGDFEVLIMDDCSPDETPTVARSFGDPRVIHLRNERNLGHLANYNKGISLAKGKYVWLINVDDYLRQSDVLQRFVEVMEKVPTAAYVFCRAFSVRNGVETAPHALHGTVDRVFRGDEFLARLVFRNTIATPAVMVRKTSYDRAGLFAPDLPHAGDWFQWCRYTFFGDVAYLAEPMVCYRLHETNMSGWYHQHPGKLIADEIEVRWRVKEMAERFGVLEGVAAATAAIAWDYGLRVSRHLTEQWHFGMTMDDFEASLRAHTSDHRLIARIRAAVLAAVGDASYQHGNGQAARDYYAQSLKENPVDVVTWTKFGLAASGIVGRTIRDAAVSLRERRAAAQ
jgi:glycosyltransferase involved in cell wall biosynthesis